VFRFFGRGFVLRPSVKTSRIRNMEVNGWPRNRLTSANTSAQVLSNIVPVASIATLKRPMRYWEPFRTFSMANDNHS
jgi:hypothetical protein